MFTHHQREKEREFLTYLVTSRKQTEARARAYYELNMILNN